ASGQLPIWIVSVFGLDPRNPVLTVDPTPIWAQAGALERGVAVRIARSHSTDIVGIGAAATSQASTPPGPVRWRLSGYETDARVLFCRTSDAVSRVAIVDGSFVRSSDR